MRKAKIVSVLAWRTMTYAREWRRALTAQLDSAHAFTAPHRARKGQDQTGGRPRLRKAAASASACRSSWRREAASRAVASPTDPLRSTRPGTVRPVPVVPTCGFAATPRRALVCAGRAEQAWRNGDGRRRETGRSRRRCLGRGNGRAPRAAVVRADRGTREPPGRVGASPAQAACADAGDGKAEGVHCRGCGTADPPAGDGSRSQRAAEGARGAAGG